MKTQNRSVSRDVLSFDRVLSPPWLPQLFQRGRRRPRRISRPHPSSELITYLRRTKRRIGFARQKRKRIKVHSGFRSQITQKKRRPYPPATQFTVAVQA